MIVGRVCDKGLARIGGELGEKPNKIHSKAYIGSHVTKRRFFILELRILE